jgi:hypothetical protein
MHFAVRLPTTRLLSSTFAFDGSTRKAALRTLTLTRVKRAKATIGGCSFLITRGLTAEVGKKPRTTNGSHGYGGLVCELLGQSKLQNMARKVIRYERQQNQGMQLESRGEDAMMQKAFQLKPVRIGERDLRTRRLVRWWGMTIPRQVESREQRDDR